MHLAPQVDEAILDRGSRQAHPKPGTQRVRGPGELGVRVPDGLGFVDYDGIPLDRAQDFTIDPQERVAGDGNIGAFVESSVGAVIHTDGKLRTETPGLSDPVLENASRRNDETPPLEDAQGLKCFPEPHIVGEKRSELRSFEKRQPVHALALILSKLTMELVGNTGFGQRGEVPDECAESLEPRRCRRVELLAQAREIGKRRAWKLTARRACREKIRDLGAVALEPVER